ncbi:MAG: Crp/Fnr family transcriptional regulator [Acutalibacteraceae bacterium]
MKEYIAILKRTILFSGIDEVDISGMLDCFDAKLFTYKKGEYVLRQGEHLNGIPVLVKGKLRIQNEDYWGNRSILSNIDAGEMFGEAYAAPGGGPILNDVVAAQDSAVIFFDIQRVLSVCPSSCRFHATVIQNLFFTISEKNRKLVQKLGHMSKRTTREKLISYLSEEAKKHNCPQFEIPFNRQQLADFLSVDRSAMSNELCKMRDEGLIAFYKNRFEMK